MKSWQIAAALTFGFLLGGFAHLWFINDVGYGALIDAGQNGFGWNVKMVGENIGAGTLFYLLGFCLYAFVACLVGGTMIVNGWWHWRACPFRRADLPALSPTLATMLFGALGAVSLNQSSITGDYQRAATEESFSASTIAIALPAMQTFTAACQRALLLALLLTLLTWGGGHRLRQRPAPSPSPRPYEPGTGSHTHREASDSAAPRTVATEPATPFPSP